MPVPRLILKGCPRCKRGDLALDEIKKYQKTFIAIYSCIQCSITVKRKATRSGQEEGSSGSSTTD